MKKEKVLNKAQEYLIKYNNSTSKYYNELKKNYNEYKNLETNDVVTNKLYEKQILKLCKYVEEKENFAFLVISLVIMIIIIVLLVGYATIKFLNTKEEVNVVIEKANSEVSLNVDSDDELFELSYSSIENYMDLRPITLSLNPVGENSYNIFYDIYIMLDSNNTISADDIKFSITVGNETKLYNLKDQNIVIDKYLLYTGNMRLNDTEKVYLRIFTDNENADLSDFNYVLKYDGYLE